jgi:hypothetical protein
MRRKFALLFFVGLIFWARTNGQGAKTAETAGEKTVVLKAARMFDGKSGAVLTPGFVVVTGNKIVGGGSDGCSTGRAGD